MFDVGFPELLTLVLIGIVMFGPERLPGIARKAGRVVKYLNAIANDAKGQLKAELGPEWDNISLADLNPKTFVARHLLNAEEIADIRGTLDETKTALDESKSMLTAAATDFRDTAQEALAPGTGSLPGLDFSVTMPPAPRFDTEAT